jgi:hypothetical protein
MSFEDGNDDRLSRNVGYYQSTLRNIPEDRRFNLHCDGSLKPRKLSFLMLNCFVPPSPQLSCGRRHFMQWNREYGNPVGKRQWNFGNRQSTVYAVMYLLAGICFMTSIVNNRGDFSNRYQQAFRILVCSIICKY